MKTCRRCKLSKPLAQMKRDTRNAAGYSSFCKACHQAASVAWQKANPERLKATRNARYARDAKKIQAQRKAARLASGRKLSNTGRLYRLLSWYAHLRALYARPSLPSLQYDTSRNGAEPSVVRCRHEIFGDE